MSAWRWATAVGFVFLFVWQQVQATRLGFDAEAARRRLTEARNRVSYLRLEFDRRTAPAALAAAARGRLGMLEPAPDHVVVLASAGERPMSTPAEAVASATPVRGPAATWLSWLKTSPDTGLR